MRRDVWSDCGVVFPHRSCDIEQLVVVIRRSWHLKWVNVLFSCHPVCCAQSPTSLWIWLIVPFSTNNKIWEMILWALSGYPCSLKLELNKEFCFKDNCRDVHCKLEINYTTTSEPSDSHENNKRQSWSSLPRWVVTFSWVKHFPLKFRKNLGESITGTKGSGRCGQCVKQWASNTASTKVLC